MGPGTGDNDGSEGAVIEEQSEWDQVEIRDLVELTELASAKAVMSVVNAHEALANSNSKGLEDAVAVVHEAASECKEPQQELMSVADLILRGNSFKLARYIRNASAEANANLKTCNEAAWYVLALQERMKLKPLK